MDPEVRKLLEETHALAKDNHRMLRTIRREQWINFFARIVVWAIVLLLPLYLYQQYVQPIISKIVPTANIPSNLLNLPSSADVQKLINSYKTGSQ